MNEPIITPVASPDDRVVLSWTVHPVRRRPVISALVIVLMLAIPTLITVLWEMPFMGGISFLMLFGSLAKFFFPTTYKLTSSAISVATMTQTVTKSYALYRSLWPDRNGVLLSPFAGPSRLEGFRGLYVMTEGNADEVLRILGQHIPSAAQAQAATTTEQAGRA